MPHHQYCAKLSNCSGKSFSRCALVLGFNLCVHVGKSSQCDSLAGVPQRQCSILPDLADHLLYLDICNFNFSDAISLDLTRGRLQQKNHHFVLPLHSLIIACCRPPLLYLSSLSNTHLPSNIPVLKHQEIHLKEVARERPSSGFKPLAGH